MYAPQSNIPSATKYFLDALNTGEAQLKTADGADTVFAQKMQQGIAQGVPQTQGMQGAKQDYAAAAPSVAQNMKLAEVQRMMQQAMQPQPAGIEGLPAQNMQGMQKMAGGGVVGYAEGGTPRTYGYAPDYEAARSMGIDLSPYDSPDVRQQKLERLQKMREFEEQRKSFGEIPTEASVARDTALQAAYPGVGREKDVIRQVQPGRTAAPPMATSPEGQRLAQAQNAPTQFDVGVGAIPALQRAARMVGGREREEILNKISELQASQPSQSAVAPTGIAASLTERPQYDISSVTAAGAPYMKAGEEDVSRLRKAEGERAEFEKTLPDLSAKGIAALQQRMTDVESAEASRKERLGLDRVIQQLLGRSQGSGGAARADIQFMNAQRAAEDAFSQAKLGNQQAQLLMEKAQQERQLGRFDRAIALEKEASGLMEKARDNALKAQQIAVQIRGQDITAQTHASDRAAQAALRNLPAFEQQMAQKVMDDYMAKNPGTTLSDAWDYYRGAGKGLEQRAEAASAKNAIARQKLLNEDMTYFSARNTYINSTDPTKKAEALRKMKEIERLNGIVEDTVAAPSGAANDPLGLRK